MKKFEYFDVTADIGFMAYGNSLSEAFENAGIAMFNIISDTCNIEPVKSIEFEITSEDRVSLLYDYLEELLFYHEIEFMLFSEFNVQIDCSGEDYHLKAIIKGEDINWDNTLDEDECYFQYRIAIHPDSLRVGTNYITDKQVANVHTRNGKTQVAIWSQFTIPLADYQKKVGSIQDFSNIRFMRMYMTGFRATTHLRFATLEFASGE